MYALEVENLTKTFRKGAARTVAVDGISFRVKKGEIFGLLGVNGAGKTTTINILTGLLEKDAGKIRLLGKDPEKDWEVKNRVNVSTAYFPLSENLTVRQNLTVYAGIYGVKNPEEKIAHLLDLFEMAHLADKRVGKLSSGEATRTALCKGLINDPDLLFLDECTVGLDPDIAEKTRRIIREYHERTGCTIVFTSHYMHEVEELCDRIAFMEKGRILQIATADELKRTIKKHTVEITVKEGPERLRKLLADKRVDVLYAEDNTLVFEVSWEDEKLYKTLNAIFREGFHLTDLHLKKPTLDDIFIKIARKE